MSSVVVERGVRAQVRGEGERARRERRLASEGSVRLRLARDAVLLSGSEDLFEKRLASSLSSITSDRDLLASLEARLCDVSVQFDAKVSSFAVPCCAVSDKFESHVATLSGVPSWMRR